MLRDDVVDAVRAGQFHIFTAETVDAALHLLTGSPPGEPGATGLYPEGSLHRLVSQRLEKYAESIRKVTAEEK